MGTPRGGPGYVHEPEKWNWRRTKRFQRRVPILVGTGMRVYQRGYYTSGPRSTPSLSSGVRCGCGEEGGSGGGLRWRRYDGGRRWIMNWRDEVVWASAAAGLVLQPRTVVPLSWRVAAQLIGSCLWTGSLSDGWSGRAPEHSTARWQPLQASFGQLGRLSDKAWRAAAISLGLGLDEDDEVSVLGERGNAGRGKMGIMD